MDRISLQLTLADSLKMFLNVLNDSISWEKLIKVNHFEIYKNECFSGSSTCL